MKHLLLIRWVSLLGALLVVTTLSWAAPAGKKCCGTKKECQECIKAAGGGWLLPPKKDYYICGDIDDKFYSCEDKSAPCYTKIMCDHYSDECKTPTGKQVMLNDKSIAQCSVPPSSACPPP